MLRLIKNFLGSGWGGCLRCKDRWSWKPPHVTEEITPGHGCFPLCEPCWQRATPKEIKYYYSELVRLWRRGGSFYSQDDENCLINIALKEKGYAVTD